MFQRLIPIAISFLLAAIASAQEITTFGTVLSTESNTVKNKLPGEQFYPVFTPIGSEFLVDEWTKGSVVLENGDRYENMNLKYNTYKNELIWFHPRTNSLIMLDKDMIREFELETGTQVMNFRKLPFDKTVRGDYYFNILCDGKLKFVNWQRTTEDETIPYFDKNGKLRNTLFVLRNNYYVVFPENRFENLKLRQRSFYAAFGKQKKEIRRYLRGKHIKYRSESGIADALKLVESKFY